MNEREQLEIFDQEVDLDLIDQRCAQQVGLTLADYRTANYLQFLKRLFNPYESEVTIQ